ncbi:MAG TPA: hypothetical protein VF490_07710 [Chryseosolibacter sp.]
MDNRNDVRRDTSKAMLVLFVLFVAIVLTEATTGTLSWVTFTGLIITGLLLFCFP